METFIAIIALVWGVLNIILFFKLWGACNDIRRIADKYDPEGKAKRDEARKEAETARERYLAEIKKNADNAKQ